jgi:hypothetical protein
VRYEPGPRPLKKYQQPADSLAAIAARERFEAAMAAMAAVGTELAGVVMHVVVDQAVSSWGPLNGHPVRVGNHPATRGPRCLERSLRCLAAQRMSDLDLLRRATDRIRDEYAVVRSERPELTPWEAFALAKQRRRHRRGERRGRSG